MLCTQMAQRDRERVEYSVCITFSFNFAGYRIGVFHCIYSYSPSLPSLSNCYCCSWQMFQHSLCVCMYFRFSFIISSIAHILLPNALQSSVYLYVRSTQTYRKSFRLLSKWTQFFFWQYLRAFTIHIPVSILDRGSKR